MKRLLSFVLLWLALGVCPAWASQGYADLPTTGVLSGLTAVQSLNANTDALLSLSASTTTPGYAVTGMLWANTGSSTTGFYDGTQFEPLFYWNTSQGTAGNPLVSILNATTTGTTVNKLAKLSGSPSKLLITATADTSGVVGVVIAGAGTSGSASVITGGEAACAFDGTTTAGDYVQISTSTAGDCHDAGSSYPSSGQILGRSTTSASGAGNYPVLVFPPGIAGASGGGSGVNNVTGDGTLITNSSSTGNVTLTLGTAAADTVWANPTGSTTTASYTTAPVVKSLGLTGTAAASAGFTGIHETTANQLSLTATGIDAMVLTTTGIEVGSPTGGNKGVGTINAQNLYVNGSAVGTSGATVTSVALADTSTTPIYTISGSPVTTSGTLDFALSTQTSNTVFAGPTSGSAAYPTFRALVNGDIPVPTTSALGGIEAIATVSHEWIADITTGGVPQLSQPTCGDISNAGTACTANTGTSGANIGLLNGSLTFSGADTFSSTVNLSSTTTVGGNLNATDGVTVSGGAVTDAPSSLSISTTTFTPVAVASNTYRIVLTSACPCLIANPSGTAVDGQKFIMEIWQPAASATKTVTFGSNYDFGTAGSPTLSTTTGAGDLLGFSYSAENSKYLYLGIQQGM